MKQELTKEVVPMSHKSNILLGDCIDQMKLVDENSIDSIVCDP